MQYTKTQEKLHIIDAKLIRGLFGCTYNPVRGREGFVRLDNVLRVLNVHDIEAT
jgi:hypothetical protein